MPVLTDKAAHEEEAEEPGMKAARR